MILALPIPPWRDCKFNNKRPILLLPLRFVAKKVNHLLRRWLLIPGRTLRIRSNLLIFLFLTMVSPALAEKVSGPTYWDSVFELGYDPDSGRASDGLACQRIEMVYDFSRLVSNHVQADQALAATYRDLRSMLSSLDAGNLYELLPYTDTDGQWRSIGISGRSQAYSYRLSEYDPGPAKQLTVRFNADGGLSDGLQRFGDLDFKTFIRPVAQDRYKFTTDLQIFTKDLSAVIIPRMISTGLTVAWDHAARADDPPEHLARIFHLNRPSLQVLGGFAFEFPDLFKTITHFFEIENIVSSITPNQDGSQIVDFRIRINREAFAGMYPEIGAVLDVLKGMIYFNGRVFDDQDRLMGMVEFDSAEDLFILQCRVLGGLLLPLNGSRTAGSSIGINLTDQALTQLYAEFDIHLNMVGLHLDVLSLQVPIDYQLNGGGLRLEACLLQPPDMVQADGRVFGFLPLWLIDMLIPSNVEKITRDFFQALATGNDGQGAIVEFAGLQRAPLINGLLMSADAEALSNGTIKLGFSLQRRFAKEQQKLIAELKAFNEQLLSAFYQDYQKVKKERGCQ